MSRPGIGLDSPADQVACLFKRWAKMPLFQDPHRLVQKVYSACDQEHSHQLLCPGDVDLPYLSGKSSSLRQTDFQELPEQTTIVKPRSDAERATSRQ